MSLNFESSFLSVPDLDTPSTTPRTSKVRFADEQVGGQTAAAVSTPIAATTPLIALSSSKKKSGHLRLDIIKSILYYRLPKKYLHILYNKLLYKMVNYSILKLKL